MIRFDNVSKQYRSGGHTVRALDGVTSEIEQGEFVAVRGPSGCGKSTFLSLAGGLALPTDGDVTVDGQVVSRLSAADRAAFRTSHIGFVFQMFHLLPYLKVIDNVMVAAERKDRAALESHARALLDKFGLADRVTHRPGQLSAGERQRVAMARAMLNEPKILLADEPTGNLDPENAAALLDLLADFHQAGGTVLMVTHDDRAASYAQRCLHLESGKIASPVTQQ